MDIFVQAFSGLLALVAGGFLLWKRPSASAVWFALFSASSGLYLMSLGALFYTQDMWWSPSVIITGALMLATAFLFALSYNRALRVSDTLLLIPLGVVIALAPTHAFVRDAIVVQGRLTPVHGVLALPLLIFVLLYVLGTWFLLRDTRNRSTGLVRAQAHLVFIACTALLVSVLVCNVGLPVFGFPQANFGSALGLLLFLGVTMHALTTRQLFDIRLGALRLFTYGIVPFSVLVGIAVCLSFVHTTEVSWLWVVVIVLGAIGGSILGQWLLRAAMPYVRRRLYEDTVDPLVAVEIVEELFASPVLPEMLLPTLRPLLVTLFHPQVIRFNADSPISGVEVTPEVLTLHIPGWGSVVLEHRRSGDVYGALEKMVADALLPVVTRAAQQAQEHMTQQESQRQQVRRVVADLAHGLQTPLMVLRASLEEAGISQSGHVNEALEDMSSRIRGLVAYTKTALSPVSTPEPVRFDLLLAQMIEYVAVVAADRGVQLAYGDFAPTTVIGVRQHLETLITNVLSNALGYAPKGTGVHTVFISLVREFHTLVCTIADTGPGMSPSDLQRAFEPLYRGAHAVPGTGMGLGLAICQQIVNSHGGSLTLAARLGGGLVVRISLPLSS